MSASTSTPTFATASRAATISSRLGFVVMAIGVLVMLGWAFSIEVLKRVFPTEGTMKPNTALGMILLGGALGVLMKSGASDMARKIGRVAAVLATLIGAVTGVEYLSGSDFGLSDLIFEEPAGPYLARPGRMDPAGALNFVILGMAVLWLERANCRVLLALSLTAALAAFLSLAGYLYDANFLNHLENSETMAFHSAIGFLLLSTGVAISCINDRLMEMLQGESSVGILIRRLMPVMILAPLILGWLRLWGQRNGFYETSFGTALFVAVMVPLFLTIIWWSARTIIHLDVQRQDAEMTVRENEQRFRGLLESAPDAMVIANGEGEIVLVNEQTERLFGYEREELIGKRVEMLMPQRFRQRHVGHREGYMEHAKARPMGIGMELFGLRKSGAEFPLEISLSPIETGNGKLISSGIRDITARKKTEAILEHERYLLSALMDNVPDRIYFKDREGRFLRNNVAHLKRLGLTDPAQALGKTDFDFFPTKHAEIAREDELEIMRGGLMIEKEERVQWDDGRVDWALVNKMPLRNPDGEIMGTFGVSHDITSRKLAEEELKALSDRLVLATKAAALGIWDFDLVSKRLIWDEQMYRIYGADPKHTATTFEICEAVMHPDDCAAQVEKFNRALAGEEFDSEFRVIWPDKSVHYVKADAIVLRDTNGKPIRMIGTNRDITNQRKAEESLRMTLAELERSNSELEQFAYVASHDLQEPLRAVTGCLQLLQKMYGTKMAAEADDLIRHSVEGAARMRTLIGDLLAFSRVGTRGQPFQRTDCEVVLKLTLENLSFAIEESGARVTHDPLPTLNADPVQLQQLFQNLIANGVKFRGDRPPQIHVSARLDHGFWLFSVRDNGIGIEPQYRERIFIIFQRLHTRVDYPGTGVGLAICKRIVERHGGSIWIDSTPGEGSTFFFTIPNRSDESP